jgi:hypothetical protein
MRRILATAAAVILLVIAGAVPANAAVGPGGRVITCNLSLDNPHKSGHVNGTISAQGRVNCDAVVAEIYVKTTLTNVTRATAASQTFDKFNVSSGSSVGAKGCREGGATFQSKMEVVVQFPPGFSPARQVANKASNNQYVPPCGVSRSATTDEEQPQTGDAGFSEWTFSSTQQ